MSEIPVSPYVHLPRLGELPSPEPEMKSLREIKEKLDRLQQSQDVLRQSTIGLLIEEVRDIADSQGKLAQEMEQMRRCINLLKDYVVTKLAKPPRKKATRRKR